MTLKDLPALALAALTLFGFAACESKTYSAEYTRVFGRYSFRMEDSDLRDDLNADLHRLRLEVRMDEDNRHRDPLEIEDPDFDGRKPPRNPDPDYSPGYGLKASFMDLDGDLHSHAGASSTAYGINDVFAYMKVITELDALIIPVCLGFTFNSLGLNDAEEDVAWRMFGGRVSFLPTYPIFVDHGMKLNLYGEAHLGMGYSWIHLDRTRRRDRTKNGVGSSMGYELGASFQYEGALLKLGYYRFFLTMEKNLREPGHEYVISGTDTDFEGIALTLGLRF